MITNPFKTTTRLSRLALLFGVVVGAQTTQAGGIVNSCTQADLQAALAGGGLVTFACDGTISLTNTLNIVADTAVDGSGRQVAISGNNAVRVFRVNPGIRLALINLSILSGRYVGTNGGLETVGEAARGGGVLNDGGSVSVTSCVFSNNSVVGGNGGNAYTTATPAGGGEGAGGAIYSASGSVALTNSLMISNSATGGASGAGGNFPGLGGGLGEGGALAFRNATMIVSGSHLFGNTAVGGAGNSTASGATGAGSAAGGGLWGSGGEATIYGAEFVGNTATGGQAYWGTFGSGPAGTGVGGAMSLTNLLLDCPATRFVGNVARGGGGGGVGVGRGGAVYGAANVRFRDCVWESNMATSLGAPYNGNPSEGGAVYSTAQFSAAGCLMVSNVARGGDGAIRGMASGYGGLGAGGGMFSRGASRLTNCTLAYNQAQGGSGNWSGQFSAYPRGGDASGGAISGGTGTGELIHVTVSGNTAVPGGVWLPSPRPPPFSVYTNFGVARGSGIYISNAAVTLRNSIAANSPSGSNCYGVVIDGGNNISSDGSCAFTAPGSLNNTDPMLSPLDDFGGPTLSMALLEGSPALNTANPAYCVATDQRGIARPFGAACDIGAFESAPPYSIRGRVTGWNLVGVGVTLGGVSTNTAADGRYCFGGLATGNYTTTPGADGQVFVPCNKPLSVGPDAINVDFHSYRSNAFTIERVSKPVSRFVFAGAQSQSYQLLTSSNLAAWTPSGSRLTDTNGIFDWFVTNGVTQGNSFFRSVAP